MSVVIVILRFCCKCCKKKKGVNNGNVQYQDQQPQMLQMEAARSMSNASATGTYTAGNAVTAGAVVPAATAGAMPAQGTIMMVPVNNGQYMPMAAAPAATTAARVPATSVSGTTPYAPQYAPTAQYAPVRPSV